MTTVLERERLELNNDRPKMRHLVFMGSDVALCGRKLTGEWLPGIDTDCVVCADIARSMGYQA